MDTSTIGYLDTWFYYFGQENTNLGVLSSIKLLEPVQPEALKQALKETMDLFPVLRKGLGMRDNRLCYVENEGPLPVFPEREAPYLLGTEETGGYLFRISYGHDTVTLSYPHGMTDGGGLITILTMLLDRYFRRVDPSYPGEEFSAVEDKVEPMDLSEADAGTPEPNQEIYRMPGMAEDYMEKDAPHYTMILPEAALMEQVRKLHTSPIPYFIALMSHATHQLYPVGDMPLLFRIPVDFRARFGVNTCRNFAPAMRLPYDASLEQLPLEERCARLRAILRERTDSQHLRQQLYQARQRFMSMPGFDIPPATLGRLLFEKSASKYDTDQTATVSYLRIAFTPEIWKRLRGTSLDFCSPPNFFVISALGNGRVRISTRRTQHMAQLCDAFAQLLQDQGIPMTVETEKKQFDRVDLKRFG